MSEAGSCVDGCSIDSTRKADSASWTCARCGGNVCLGCHRPVEGSGVYCDRPDCGGDVLGDLEPFNSDDGDPNAHVPEWHVLNELDVPEIRRQRKKR